MHHRHTVLHGDRLPPALLNINIASGKTRKNQRLLAVDEMTAIKLGGNGDGQPQASHRSLGNGLVRHRGDEVAAKPNEYLCAPVDHRLQGVHDTVSVPARHFESKYFLDLVEQLRFGLLVDAYGSIPLHIRVAANRT